MNLADTSPLGQSDENSLRDLFCCPECRGTLTPEDRGFHCEKCRRIWLLRNGIPCFVREGNLEEYVLEDGSGDLAQQALRKGWRAAIDDFADKRHLSPYKVEYMTSEARADFRFLIPFRQAATVLDIGCGWGNISTAFARNCRLVYALDRTLASLQFVRIRAEQEGLRNVIAVLGDAAALPVPDASIDIAIMVGVLEWVAWGRSDGSPIELQSRVLRRVWETLKVGGYMYLAIENRLGFKYFLGAREPHTGLRFINLLPRHLGDLYSRLIRNQPYRELIHSRWELERLLRQAGFGEINFWDPIPGYQNFRYLVRHDNRQIDRFVLRSLRSHAGLHPLVYWPGEVGFGLSLHRLFCSCFSIVARKTI